jgi:hypothetical protein
VIAFSATCAATNGIHAAPPMVTKRGVKQGILVVNARAARVPVAIKDCMARDRAGRLGSHPACQ